MNGRLGAKQISEVEEKPFTSSLDICPEACLKKGVGWGRVTLSYFPADPCLFHFKTT